LSMAAAVIERNHARIQVARKILSHDRSFALTCLRLVALRAEWYRSRGLPMPEGE
jgi:hypothetical protein